MIPNINGVRLTSLTNKKMNEEEGKIFCDLLKNKILKNVAKSIERASKMGKFHTTVGFWNDDSLDGHFEHKENRVKCINGDIDIEPTWLECVNELKTAGYDASIDINIFEDDSTFPYGSYKGYYLSISWHTDSH